MPARGEVPLSNDLLDENLAANVFDDEGHLVLVAGARLTAESLALLNRRGVTDVPIVTYGAGSNPTAAGAAVGAKAWARPVAEADLVRKCVGCQEPLPLRRPTPLVEVSAWACRSCGEYYIGAATRAALAAHYDPARQNLDPVELLLFAKPGKLECPAVPRVLAERASGYAGEEKRQHTRFGIAMPAAVAPVDEHYRVVGAPVHLTTSNVSMGGVAFEHSSPFTEPFLLTEFSTPRRPRLQMLMRICRSDQRDDRYEIGGEWVCEVEKHA